MDNKEILDIKEAIKALNNKEILLSNNTYFFKQKDRVKIIGKNTSYELSLDDFENLYSKNQFIIFEDNGVTIDYLKDEQYYNEFKHK